MGRQAAAERSSVRLCGSYWNGGGTWLIADGLDEANRRGVELGATPPEHSLLVTWDGQRVPLRTPLGPGADARMDDKIGDPRDAHSGDATPRGPASGRFRTQDGAWHVTDLSKKIAHGVSIARLPGGSVLLGSRVLGRFDGEEAALEWVRTGDLEEWLRLQQDAAASSSGTAGPSAQDARVLAVETLRTEGAQPNLRLSSRLDGADRDGRLANTTVLGRHCG